MQNNTTGQDCEVAPIVRVMHLLVVVGNQMGIMVQY
jgi:hypothetical protein